MPGRSRAVHAAACAVFAILAVVWTWPLARHMGTHTPGAPGDNFSFLWNLWWMRRVLDSPDLSFFHSTHLFFPFGVDLVNHPHTALQAWISATALRRLTIVEAENLHILVSMFANAAAAYALAFDITRHARLSILAAAIFAGSPYMAGHLLGHFDLLSAWVMPVFALCFRRALISGSTPAMIGCGLALAAAAHTAYYYVVYVAIFAAAYLVARWQLLSMSVGRRPRSRAAAASRSAGLTLMAAGAALAAYVVATGGGRFTLAGATISVRTIQNPLTVFWVGLLVAAAASWTVAIRVERPERDLWQRGGKALAWMTVVFVVFTAPLIYEAVVLALEGRYVTQPYLWRSGPRGIDLVSLVSGNPFHPVTGGATQSIYRAIESDIVEAVAWVGLVPLVVLGAGWRSWPRALEARCWTAVLAVSFVWALGPRLLAAGVDLGLPLPQLLARYVPVVSNARMPGRTMVLVYLAFGILVALRLAAAGGRWRSAALQWALVALAVVDGLGAPVPLTRLERPPVYDTLASLQDGGAVCEVPFGIGDGLTGTGSQMRETLYFATIHGHPMVGGYIGRMPPGAEENYRRTPVVGNLLRLANGEATVPEPAGDNPCRYLVVDKTAAPAATLAYLDTLETRQVADDGRRRLLAIRAEYSRASSAGSYRASSRDSPAR